MAEITAKSVKDLREKTGLPMMDCKEALTAVGGDEQAAIDYLRKKGLKISGQRTGKETASGRFGTYANLAGGGALVELKCESAPVAANEEFIRLANDLATQLATGPGAATAEELLGQPSPSKPGTLLKDQLLDLLNRIRENFVVGRMVRFDGPCGAYSHNSGTVSGVLLEFTGTGTAEAAKDVCMHVAAMRPRAMKKEELPEEVVAKEREILREAALKEGKPEAVVDKMVEGRLRNFFAEQVLNEQPFVKDDKQTVGQYAKANGMTLSRFVLWELGKE